jgi:hypothetical protein
MDKRRTPKRNRITLTATVMAAALGVSIVLATPELGDG